MLLAPFVVVKNGVVLTGEEATVTARALLLRHPAGIYSGARTLDKKKIIEFSSHLTRLKKAYGNAENLDVKALVVPSIELALRTFLEQNKLGEGREIFFIFLVTNSHDFFVHTSELDYPVSNSVAVEIRGKKPRDNPQYKSTTWVAERIPFEDAKSPGVNEVILQDNQGRLYEGIQSNFFIVKGDTVYCAPLDTTLQGTIQLAVLNVCKKNSIPVIFQHPLKSEANLWNGAFITSTRRLVLPINAIGMPEDQNTPTYQIDPHNNLIKNIQQLLIEELRENAVAIC